MTMDTLGRALADACFMHMRMVGVGIVLVIVGMVVLIQKGR